MSQAYIVYIAQWYTCTYIAIQCYDITFQEAFGSVYCYGVDGTIKRIDTGYKFPNGIAVQYDGGKPNNLIVAETATKTLWSFPFVDGENMSVDVSKKAVFGKCPGIIAKAYDTIYFNKNTILV